MAASTPAIALCAATLAVALCAGGAAAQGRGPGTQAARALADEYLAAHHARYPETNPADSAGLFDNRPEAGREWSRREDAFLTRLRRIAAGLEPGSPEAVTLALLRERLEMSRQFEVCRRELWNVSPLTGWLNEFRGHAARQPTGDDAARRAALARWSRLPGFIDQEIDNLRAGLRAGYSAPHRLVVATVAQADQILDAPLAASPFFGPAARDTAPAFRAAWETLVRDRIHAALRRYRDYLAKEYAPRARRSVGVGALPRGEACFRALVRRYTTLDTVPRALVVRGRALLAAADPDGIRARERALLADPANRFTSSREALETMAAALARAGQAAPRWFNRLPAPLVPEVDSMPEAGPTDPDAFYAPGDGGEPPRIYVNLSRLLEPGGRLYAERLAFHEGLPGHHLQVALQRSSHAHPLNRMLWNAGFGEGWAVYASNLADEMRLYSSEASRAGVAASRRDDGLTFVVQAGLHLEGWSPQAAVDTLLRYWETSREAAEQQVDYYIAAPAHALAYPVGARYLEDLRAAAARRLGARFDVRRFHDLVLESGALPLAVLREAVDRWATSATDSGTPDFSPRERDRP